MLIKTFLMASLSLLLAACQTTTPPEQRINVDDIATPPPSYTQASQQQAQQHRAQSVITVHVAQQQADDRLVTIDVGEGKLYAIPQPVLIQSDMQQVTPVTAQNGDTFIMLEMNDQGRQKLASVTEQAQRSEERRVGEKCSSRR